MRLRFFSHDVLPGALVDGFSVLRKLFIVVKESLVDNESSLSPKIHFEENMVNNCTLSVY